MLDRADTCDDCEGPTDEGFPISPSDPTLLNEYTNHITFILLQGEVKIF